MMDKYFIFGLLLQAVLAICIGFLVLGVYVFCKHIVKKIKSRKIRYRSFEKRK